MRRGQKEQVEFLSLHLRPRKRMQRRRLPVHDLRIRFIECRGRMFTPPEQDGRAYVRMLAQQPRQLEARVSGRAHHSTFDLLRHYASSSLMRCPSRCADRLSSVTIRMVSSPAIVPSTSFHASPSSDAATGCALPTAVFTTSM